MSPLQAGPSNDAGTPGVSRDVTQLLQQWSLGDLSALGDLMPLVFEDLRYIARAQFQREAAGHTLQPTALVSEVYLRLYDQRQVHWENRKQFFAFAALLMRRILVDYAKGRHTAKRGGGLPDLPLDEALSVPMPGGIDLVDLDDALTRLAAIDERQSRVVELRFFVGLTNEEAAEVLGVSLTAVKRDWRTAKIWLHREMTRR
jgi:RNA polymerase sigma factor (TIGR02999 family)